MRAIIENLSPHVAIDYRDGQLKTILLRKGCDKIEWEAVRHQIEFELDELIKKNNDDKIPHKF